MRSTIKKHKDFAITENEKVAKGPLFLARARLTLFPDDARYGLIATKRTFKPAVKRNRAKRLLRVWIRENEYLMKPELDYIFIARAPILDASRDDGIAAMAKAIKYLNK